MTEQEIADLKTKAASLEVEAQTAKTALATAEANTASTVEELKNLRTAKQEVEAKLTLAESKLNPHNSSQGNVEEQVNTVLAKKEEERLVALKDDTERKFKESHSEFHPDTDTGGLKYAAFKQKLARMNLAGLKSEDELTAAFEDALVLLNKRESTDNGNFNPYAATTKTNSGEPKGVNGSKLQSNELKLIQQLGWTEERYLKTKKAQPHFVDSMLAQFK
jgi:chromosome segregation ATPase